VILPVRFEKPFEKLNVTLAPSSHGLTVEVINLPEKAAWSYKRGNAFAPWR